VELIGHVEVLAGCGIKQFRGLTGFFQDCLPCAEVVRKAKYRDLSTAAKCAAFGEMTFGFWRVGTNDDKDNSRSLRMTNKGTTNGKSNGNGEIQGISLPGRLVRRVRSR
jgi:hypothetical protein